MEKSQSQSQSPIGFHPNEFDKIAYLVNKVSGESSPSEDFIDIPTIDVYGKREPWEIFDELLEDEETHFFSNLKIKRRRKRPGSLTHHFFNNLKIKRRRKKRGSLCEHLRPRSVGAGAWKICVGRTYDILYSGEGIGFMSRYVYRSSPFQAHQDKRWILEEYTLSGPMKDCLKIRYNGFRFCTLKKNQNLAIDVPDHMWPQRMIDEMEIKAWRKRKRDTRTRAPGLHIS